MVAEHIKYRWNQGKDHHLYFFRDNHGLEVDVIFQSGHQLKPIEIKLSATYSSEFGRKLKKFLELTGNRAVDPEIIFTGTEQQEINGIKLLPWTDMKL